MTSCQEVMGWGFWDLKKKTVSWDSRLEEGSWFSRARRGQTSSFRRGAARGGVRWKSQHRKELCLSLLVSKNLKLKKVIKSFVPGPKKRVESVSCFSDSYMIMNICERFMHVNILVLFLGPIYYMLFLVDLGRVWCAESKNNIGFAPSGQVFELWPHVVFFTFLFTCTHVWSILEEVGGGKITCLIVLIRNDYFDEKKYSGTIAMGDFVEKGSVWSYKTSKSSKNGAAKHEVGGLKLKLMGQPPQEVYSKLHPRIYWCFRFMCFAE